MENCKTLFDPTAWLDVENESNQVKVETTNTIKARPSTENVDELAKAEAVCKELIAQGANIAESYEDYLKLGFALAQGLGNDGRDIYHQLCSQSTKYNRDECEKQWQDCLAKGNGSVTIASFYKMAQDAGVDQRTVDVNDVVEEQPEEEAEVVHQAEKSPIDFSEQTLSEIYSSTTPPKYKGKMPRLVEYALKSTPTQFREPVAQAIFPALAIYPKDLKFPYIDNQLRELRINCLLVGGTGNGKDSCVRQPLNHILADAKELSEMNRQRLAKYNEEYNSKSNNSEKPKRPEDLVIQIIKSDITKAALYQRMDEAQGAPLYVKLSELEQWDKVEGATGKANQFTTLKMADDEENDFGSDRASTQSVTASGSLFLNWNANATINKAVKYFKYALIDGALSRLCMGMVPESEIGGDIPVYGSYDSSYDDKLRPYIENLKAATGIVKCPKALQLIKQLKKECDDFSVLTQDRVFDNLTHRALVQVFRKACLLYAANGMKWEKSIEPFCRWSLHYDLWIKMNLWGDAIKKEEADVETSKRGPQSLLDQVTKDENGIFTFEAIDKLRKQKSPNKGNTRNLISKWKSRGLIEDLGDDRFRKKSDK